MADAAGSGAAADSGGPASAAAAPAAVEDAVMDENGGKCKGFLEAIDQHRAKKKGRKQ